MKIKIWDIWIRVFHALLIIVVLSSLVTGVVILFPSHYYLGLTVLSLLIMRILLGVVGSTNTKFAVFLKSPKTAIRYVKNAERYDYGHNPIGGYSTLLFMLSLLFQAISGLFLESIEAWYSAPLSHHISESTAQTLETLHRGNSNLLIALIVIHVAVVMYYQFIKKNTIITAFITGSKDIQRVDASKLPRLLNGYLGAGIFLLSVGVGVFLLKIL